MDKLVSYSVLIRFRTVVSISQIRIYMLILVPLSAQLSIKHVHWIQTKSSTAAKWQVLPFIWVGIVSLGCGGNDETESTFIETQPDVALWWPQRSSQREVLPKRCSSWTKLQISPCPRWVYFGYPASSTESGLQSWLKNSDTRSLIWFVFICLREKFCWVNEDW